MHPSEFDAIVEKIVRNSRNDDPYDIADEVAAALLARPKSEASPLVAEAAMPRVLRHLRRLVQDGEEEQYDDDPYDSAANTEILETDDDLATPDDLPSPLRSFIDRTVRIPGVGLVRWGEVTLEQHLARVKWIESKVGGMQKTKTRHQDSIRYCRKYFANTLYEAIKKSAEDQ